MFVLATIGTVLVLVVPNVSRRIIDDAIPARDASLILPLAVIAVAAVVARQGLFTARTLVNNRFELRLAHDRRVEVYEKLQRLPIRWFDDRSTGDVLSRVSADVPAMQRVVLEGIDQGMTAVLQIALVLAYLFWTDAKLALLMTVPMPLIFLGVAVYHRRAAPRAAESSAAAGGVQAILGDHLGGIHQIKAFAVEGVSGRLFDAASRRLRGASMAMVKLNAMVWPGVAAVTEVWMVVTIAVSAAWIIDGSMTIGTLTAALLLWGILYEPVGRLPPIVGTLASGSAAADRVFEVLDQPDEADLEQGLAPEVRGGIELDDVWFGYEPDRPVLRGLSLSAAPGQTIALVGPTGGGKTTVLNLLTRFHDVDAGMIRFDGVDARDIAKRHLRRNLGYVTQSPFLFNTTVAENLRLARPDATDDDLRTALESAQAAEFVRELDGGLEASTGERGSKLSGGQRQRLSIARVLLKDPPVLLLDEATSAVDNRTERLIQAALDNVRRGRTTIVIAHRLDTIRSADRIYFLKDGVAVESGTHEELLVASGPYASLHG